MIETLDELVYDSRYGIGKIKSITRKEKYDEVFVRFNYKENKYTADGYELSDESIVSTKPVLFSLEKYNKSVLTGEFNEHPLTITKNLYPGQLVIARHYSTHEWTVTLFSYYNITEIPTKVTNNIAVYRCCNDEWYKFCLPLDGFEEYVGTTEIPEFLIVQEKYDPED